MTYTSPQASPPSTNTVVKGVVLGLVGIVLVVALGVGGCAGLKAFGRAQRRADASNTVAITHILIQRAQQQARITNAEIAATIAAANKRYQEAVGIRRAQDEISRTLTPLYVQHEAIQAEEEIANSGRNSTFVYIPSGNGGIPLVNSTPHP